MEAQEILDVMNIIAIDVRIPSVTAVTSRRIDGDESVYRPVTAIFADSRNFAPFHAIKRRMGRVCLSCGTKLCGGFAVPDDNLESVLQNIRDEQSLFLAEKTALVNRWPEPVMQWIAKHPNETFQISSVAPNSKEVDEGLSCEIRVYKVSSSSVLAQAGIEDGLAKQLSGVGIQILREIEVEANNAWKSRSEKGSSSQEIRKSLSRWLHKVQYLSFLDSRLVNVEQLIRKGISGLPTTGKIEGPDFLALSGLMSLLCSSDLLLSNLTLDIGREEQQFVPRQPELLIGW